MNNLFIIGYQLSMYIPWFNKYFESNNFEFIWIMLLEEGSLQFIRAFPDKKFKGMLGAPHYAHFKEAPNLEIEPIARLYDNRHLKLSHLQMALREMLKRRKEEDTIIILWPTDLTGITIDRILLLEQKGVPYHIVTTECPFGQYLHPKTAI